MNDDLSLSLSHGEKFIHNQKKNKTNGRNEVGKEGFYQMSESTLTLKNDTDDVLERTHMTSVDKEALKNLKQEYANTLTEYKTLQSKIHNKTNEYLTRTNPISNPYLGKKIQLDNAIFYVTNQGIAKLYPHDDVYSATVGKNGCGSASNIIKLDLPYKQEYATAGAVIPSTPRLITGTVMVSGQSCGSEGENVYVNEPIKLSNATYKGTYVDDNMTLLEGSNYTYNMCAQRASQSGYQYFGVQNAVDGSQTGYCGATNDLSTATQLGISSKTGLVTPLWSSKTNGYPGAYAKLDSLGALQVYDSTGKSIFSTTGATGIYSNYWGCYQDTAYTGERPLPNWVGNYGMTTTSCMKDATDNNQTFFGMQNTLGENNAQCFTGTDLTAARKAGKATNCSKDTNNTIVGGGWSNALYGVEPGFTAFIVLQSDGNMCINKGTGPTDNQGGIWCSSTNGKLKDANTNWKASTGKYSGNVSDSYSWVSNGFNGVIGSDNGFILQQNESFSNKDGSMKLLMQTDGNLVLYTSTIQDNYSKGLDGKKIGGTNATALYDFGGKPGEKIVGTLAYIDGDGTSHIYGSDNSKVSTGYTEFNDSNNGYGVSSSETYYDTSQPECEKKCDTYSDASGGCFGYITSNNNNCYIKKTASQVYPLRPLTLQQNWTSYIKDNVPKTPIYSNTTTNVTGNKFNGYTAGEDTTSFNNVYDLSSSTSVETAQLSQLQDKLTQLASSISTSNNTLSSDTTSIFRQSNDNIVGTQKYLDEYKITETQREKRGKMVGMLDGILNNSNIVVLQKNYTYVIWAVLLAICIFIISTILKKNVI
mgnify:CR=1 FL=1|tara:strand:+ start:1650 stop:4094 length:2445 start_codon:yes stop_codon:yes gene_type:complete